MSTIIRKAKREDTNLILSLIKGIAEYEKLLSEVEATEGLLEKELFDENNAKVLLAYYEGKAVGFALYFYNFSTFKGKKGLYLEDLFVLPNYRGKGIGNDLFNYLVEEAYENKCGRMEWVCLDWNESAIKFYKKKKAIALDGWTVFRLDELDF
ncbi:GNAT family N-acetyltransferase [Mycoplasmatota bacterium WC30]